MLWSETKKWAKSIGYDSIKDKDDGKYYWTKSDCNHPSCSGVANSVSKLAKAIYNHFTDNKWVEYQQEYLDNKAETRFSISDYGK